MEASSCPDSQMRVTLGASRSRHLRRPKKSGGLVAAADAGALVWALLTI